MLLLWRCASDRLANEDEETRRKRLLAQQQARLTGGASGISPLAAIAMGQGLGGGY